MPDIDEVRRRHENELMALPHVVGVSDGISGVGSVIQVLVDRPGEYPDVPSNLGGFPVEIVTVGDIGSHE